MAYGQTQVFVASPQPGTSNLPYPDGRTPAFVPVVVTVTDTYGEAIAAQTVALVALLQKIDYTLAQINNSLQEIIPNYESVPFNLEKAAIPLLSLAGATGFSTVIDAARVPNQIKKNNFDKAVLGQANAPTMPETAVQIKESVVDGKIMQTSITATVKVIDIIIGATVSIQNWILSTDTYTSFTKWFDDAKNRFLKLFLPPSAAALESSAKLIAGDPTTTTQA
jgi:hypothetical protein